MSFSWTKYIEELAIELCRGEHAARAAVIIVDTGTSFVVECVLEEDNHRAIALVESLKSHFGPDAHGGEKRIEILPERKQS